MARNPSLSVFIEPERNSLEWAEPILDEALLKEMLDHTPGGLSEADAAVSLLDLIESDLKLESAEGGEMLSDAEMKLIFKVLKAVEGRAKRPILHPFSSHSEWQVWASERGAHSIPERLGLLAEVFADFRRQLAGGEAPEAGDTPPSPIVDEVGRLQDRLAGAQTPDEFRLLCEECLTLLRRLTDSQKH